jgi:hypothetical protein
MGHDGRAGLALVIAHKPLSVLEQWIAQHTEAGRMVPVL